MLTKTRKVRIPLTGFLLGLLVTAITRVDSHHRPTSGLVGGGYPFTQTIHRHHPRRKCRHHSDGQIIRLLDIDGDASSWLNIFKPSTLAPVAAIIGILVIMTLHSSKSDIIGKVAMGFGILFTGLLNMTAAVAPLSESETFANLFIRMQTPRCSAFWLVPARHSLIQSSSATIGILQALSVTGALTFSSVYAIIIGVNRATALRQPSSAPSAPKRMPSGQV